MYALAFTLCLKSWSRGTLGMSMQLPGDVVFPAVVDAAQAALLVAAEEQRGAAVRAAMVHDADPAGAVAEGDQLFPEQHQANRRAVAHKFRRQRRRYPVAAHQISHDGAGCQRACEFLAFARRRHGILQRLAGRDSEVGAILAHLAGVVLQPRPCAPHAPILARLAPMSGWALAADFVPGQCHLSTFLMSQRLQSGLCSAAPLLAPGRRGVNRGQWECAATAGARWRGARMQRRIEALLFDLGRVVIDLDQARAHARWAELARVPMRDIAALVGERIFAKEVYCRHERGEISDAQFFAHLRQQLKLTLSDAQFVDGWNSIFIGEIAGIRRLLANLQGRFAALCVLQHQRGPSRLLVAPFSRDLLCAVSQTLPLPRNRGAKPEPAAFRTVVADMGLAPERVLFSMTAPRTLPARGPAD